MPLPSNIIAISSDAHSDLLIKLNGSTAKIEMPGIPQIQQVCPLAQNKIIVFGLGDPANYDMALVGGANGSLMDHFGGLDPLVSPDQRWLAYRAFHSVSAEVSMSEQYRLYDLSKNAKENRVTSEDPQ